MLERREQYFRGALPESGQNVNRVVASAQYFLAYYLRVRVFVAQRLRRIITTYAELVMIEVDKVADYLLVASRERGENLTNLKLQKLLYYSQAWFLSIHDEPLFEGTFQAWVHGPVLTSQYARFKANTWRPIMDDVEAPELPPQIVRHLDEILDVFGTESAIALEAMTHAEDPWREARGNIPPDQSSSAAIKNETMKRYYRSL